MTNTNDLVPFSEMENSPVDLNLAVQQAHQMHHVLDQMGISEAKFKTGTRYESTPEKVTVSGDGLLVQIGEHVTTVAYRHTDSTPKEAIEEIRQLTTQKNAGAFSSVSQPTISNIEND